MDPMAGRDFFLTQLIKSQNLLLDDAILWILSSKNSLLAVHVMNIKWDYNYYQPWSDNEWLVDEILAMLDEDITMQ